MGASLAELLQLDGCQVTIVTPHLEVAPLCNETLEGPRLRHRLHELGIEMVTTASLSSVTERGARIRDQFRQETEVAASAAVVVTQRLCRTALYHDLTRRHPQGTGIEGIYRTGDSVAPTLLAHARFDR